MKNFRAAGRIVILALAVLTANLCSAGSARAERVRVAYSSISGAMGPLWTANDLGLFNRNGLDVQLLYIGGGSVVTQAFLDKNRDVALRFLRAYAEGIHRVKTDRETTLKIYSKYTKVQDPEILVELYRIYGVKHLESIPAVKLEAVDEVLRSELKSGAAVKAADFVDNSLVAELEREGFFRKLYR